MNRLNRLTLAALTLATLTACGGGGSGPSGTTTSTWKSSFTAIPAAGTLVTQVPATNYVPGSLADQQFAELNALRSAVGVGLLTQNAQLQTAATAHATYTDDNGFSGIPEVPGKPGYYAADNGARATLAGYPWVSIVEAFTGAWPVSGMIGSVREADALLNRPATDVALGYFADYVSIKTGQIGNVIDFGSTAPAAGVPQAQVTPSGFVSAVPLLDGSTVESGTYYAYAESPKVPTITTATAGTPVLVNIANSDFVNGVQHGSGKAIVTAFSMADSTGAAVPAVVIASQTITASGLVVTVDTALAPASIALIPLAPLPPGVYTITFASTVAGVTANRTWSFTAK